PPRPICPICHSADLENVEFNGKGELLSYTVIHIASLEFQSIAPYVVGIVKLEEGPKIPGIIKDVKIEELKIGKKLIIDFDGKSQTWPGWAKYFFRPFKASPNF
ncbi:MAG: OB-fold domain-containing protein, partial [Candidatus Bathyarchaeota archaeon]